MSSPPSPELTEAQLYKQKKKKQAFWMKIVLSIGSLLFLLAGVMPMFLASQRSSQESAATQRANQEATDLTAQLKQQEAGFVAVLEREPNNPNALQGLVQIRLQLGDLEGAKVPLEQLIQQYPKEQVLKDLLVEVNSQIEKQGSGTDQTAPTASPTTPPDQPTTDNPPANNP